uniref:Uncharacterized protein n=1 Tax=Timema cristinae TaxID=61476 RepID=A0A7R9CIX6_TIMCR|nr:unnamed protein product [Timema cristinae]
MMIFEAKGRLGQEVQDTDSAKDQGSGQLDLAEFRSFKCVALRLQQRYFIVQAMERVSQRFSNWLSSTAERVASVPLGQSALQQMGRFLYVVEESLQWTLPRPLPSKEPIAHICEEDGFVTEAAEPAERKRPLPWVLFVPLLAALKAVGAFTNVYSWILNMAPPKTEDMIQAIHCQQRNLRAVKFRGLRRMREQQSDEKAKTSKLSGIMFVVIFWPAVVSVAALKLVSGRYQTLTQSGQTTPLATPDEEKKQKSIKEAENSSSDENETVSLKLKRVVSKYRSEDDSDFEPLDTTETDDPTCSSSDGDIDKTQTPAAATLQTPDTSVLDTSGSSTLSPQSQVMGEAPRSPVDQSLTSGKDEYYSPQERSRRSSLTLDAEVKVTRRDSSDLEFKSLEEVSVKLPQQLDSMTNDGNLTIEEGMPKLITPEVSDLKVSDLKVSTEELIKNERDNESVKSLISVGSSDTVSISSVTSIASDTSKKSSRLASLFHSKKKTPKN